MNWFDFLLAALLLFHVFNGYSKGLARQFFDLFGFILVLMAALWGSRLFSAELAEYIDPADIIPHHEIIERLELGVALEKAPQLVAGLIAFLVLFFLLTIAFRLFSSGFRWVNRIPIIGLLNRAGGAFVGALLGLLFGSILISVISLLPLQFFMDTLDNSEMARYTESYFRPAARELTDRALHFYLDLNN